VLAAGPLPIPSPLNPQSQFVALPPPNSLPNLPAI